MLEIEEVVQWLRDGEDWDSAIVLSQCSFSYEEYEDWDMRMETEMAGYVYNPIYNLKVETPRRILKLISTELKPKADKIEAAIRECAQPTDLNLRDIRWIPKLRSEEFSPPDPEIEAALATLDSEHVQNGWTKALNRRQSDPDGAITAAKTLVESVCKHILVKAGVKYPPNSDTPKLYHMVAEQLKLSPNQHIDKKLKSVLGNCEAVVGGIAFIRNNLGDAHSPEPGSTAASPADAELAVNLAGAIATYLARTWESHNKNTEQKFQPDFPRR